MSRRLNILITLPALAVAVLCLARDESLLSFARKVGGTYVFFAVLIAFMSSMWRLSTPPRGDSAEEETLMSDDIRIHRLPPYPGRNPGDSERRPEDGKPEGDAEKPPRARTAPPPEPEVKDGHIDTRVAPQSRERTFV